MAFDFKQAAQKATTLSDLMTDKTKLNTEDLIDKYPDGFTITAFDIVSTDAETTFPVFSIKEEPDSFYCGGAVLMKIVNNFIEGFHGDIDAASNELGRAGGLRIRLEESKTKKGNSLTRVFIV